MSVLERALISEPDTAPTASKAVCVRLRPEEFQRLTEASQRYGRSIPELLRLGASTLLNADDTIRQEESP